MVPVDQSEKPTRVFIAVSSFPPGIVGGREQRSQIITISLERTVPLLCNTGPLVCFSTSLDFVSMCTAHISDGMRCFPCTLLADRGASCYGNGNIRQKVVFQSASHKLSPIVEYSLIQASVDWKIFTKVLSVTVTWSFQDYILIPGSSNPDTRS